jgi:arsenite-transporting ATPase
VTVVDGVVVKRKGAPLLWRLEAVSRSGQHAGDLKGAASQMSTRYLFFSGKGGVGKTTMACATAVQEADIGLKTLIVTTDAASNLADVFEQPIGHQVTPIAGVPNLWAVEIDPDKATEEYRQRILEPFRAMMPEDVIKVLEEQFRSACTTELASFDRFIDFMDGSEFDLVIFDTAPTGHTIRLLELPVDWSKFISDSARGSGKTCMGPVQAIQESKDKYDRAIAFLRDPNYTRFVFVLQPEQAAIFETERFAAQLKRIGIESQELIVNGLLPSEVCEQPLFRKRYEMQQRHLTKIRKRFLLPAREVLLQGGEVTGVKSLRKMALALQGDRSVSIAAGSKVGTNGNQPVRAIGPDDFRALLTPSNGTSKAIFFTGKAGAGKSSISSITAVHLARQGLKTLLLTTDPAAHVGQVLYVPVGDRPAPVAAVPGLWAARIDPKTASEEYKARVLKDARTRYSEDMMAALREELESPCTEEMAAFDKFTEYVDSDNYDVIVFDTAPTGHTLRLLELPFDYSQQVELMVTTTQQSSDIRAETQARFKSIISRLRDPVRSVFVFVVCPESTPILEAHRAMLDLKDAGIPTQLVVVNQVIPEDQATNSFFRSRRAMQVKHLGEIEHQFGVPVLVLPLLDQEIRGLPVVTRAAAILFGASAPAVQNFNEEVVCK